MSAKLLRFVLAVVCIGAVPCSGLADATYNESANSTNGKMSGAENVGAINAATVTISGKTALPSDQDWYKIIPAGAKLSWTASRTGVYATEHDRSSMYLYDKVGTWVANILLAGNKKNAGTCNVNAGSVYYVAVKGNGQSDHIQSYSIALSSTGNDPGPDPGPDPETTYTIQFNANGGTGDMSDQVCVAGENTRLKANQFKKTGYRFLGWYIGSPSSHAAYADQDVVNLLNAAGRTYTFYAVWEQIIVTPTSYTVTYKPGAYGVGNSQTATKTKDVALTLKGAIFTRTGYTQTGWATSDGGGKRYSLNAAYTSNSSITLYPYWTSDPKTLSVFFDPRGGYVSENVRFVEEGRTIGTLPSATLDGYRFEGWYTSVSGGTKLLSSTVIVAGGTYYAHWTAIPPTTYTVRYNANGGSGRMADQTFTEGVAQPLTANAFTNAGHAFVGWATSAGGSSKYQNGQRLAVTANMTLYAVWEKKEEYVTIGFDAPDAWGGSPESRQALVGGTYWFLPTLVRTGYELEGWYTASGVKVTFDTRVTSAQTLRARWKPHAYTIHFNANGGEGTMASLTINYDETKNLPLCSFTRSGYSFAGWSVYPNGSVTKVDGGMVYNLTSSKDGSWTYYAIWNLEKPDLEITSMLIPDLEIGKTWLGRRLLYYDYTRAQTLQITVENKWRGVSQSTKVNVYLERNPWDVERFCTIDIPSLAGGESYTASYLIPENTFSNQLYSTSYQMYAYVDEENEIDEQNEDNNYTYDTNCEEAELWMDMYSSEVPLNPKCLFLDITNTWSSVSLDYAPVRIMGQLFGEDSLEWAQQYKNGSPSPWDGLPMSYEDNIKDHYIRVRPSFSGMCRFELVQDRLVASNSLRLTITGAGETELGTLTLMGEEASGYIDLQIERGVEYIFHVEYTSLYTGAYESKIAYEIHVKGLDDLYVEDSAPVGAVFSVAFDAAGGDMETSVRDYRAGMEWGEFPVATKTGYSVDGWYYFEDGFKRRRVHEGDLAYMHVNSLQAYWSPNRYEVAFNANGGVGTMAALGCVYDQSSPLPPCAFTRRGYTFAGWAKSATAGVSYADGAAVRNLTAENGGTVTLYAVWKPIAFSVAYVANGGTGSMARQVFTYDRAQALRPNAFSRVGHAFAGWSRTPGGDVAFVDGETVSNLTAMADGVVTLYAAWTPSPYVVTFDANGGTGGWSRTMDYGALISAPGVTRLGYSLVGWKPAVAATVPAGDVTYVAQWTTAWIVTFNASGGRLDDGVASQMSVAKGGSVGALPTPARDGYVFKGWFTKKSGGTKITAETKVKRNFTCYARWVAKKYKVGVAKSGKGTVTGAGSKAYDAKMTLKAKATKGYAFCGWYDEEGDLVSQKTSYSFKTPLGGAEMTAVFKKESALARPMLTWDEMDFTVGVSYLAKLSVAGESLVSVTKVTGLPKGLTFKSGKVSGVPTVAKAVTAKVTVALKSNAKKTWTYSVKLDVAPLPAWAVGTFKGKGTFGGKDADVTLTVGKTGKISGKFVDAKKKAYSFTAASFAEFDAEGVLRTAKGTLKYGTKTCKVEIAVAEGEAEVAVTGAVTASGALALP